MGNKHDAIFDQSQEVLVVRVDGVVVDGTGNEEKVAVPLIKPWSVVLTVPWCAKLLGLKTINKTLAPIDG